MLHEFLEQFQTPLQNPVLQFSLILFIILFAPILLNKLRIPHLIGLIIAGALIGPFGFNFMLRDSSIQLYGTVGLLYIMFLAGLEIDMIDFKKNSYKSLVFGVFTFFIPLGLASLLGYYILFTAVPMSHKLATSILFASMLGSHTLITYPIVSKFGVVRNRAVGITAGGTIITDTLALLFLAVIVASTQRELDYGFWTQLGVSLVIFALIIIFLFPLIARWFFKHYNDKILQYIFILAMVFLGAFLAEIAGVEGIIGAFLTGLSLNKLIPRTSSLMNRIEFVGNALFIPIFLIGVGMLINYRAFLHDFDTIIAGVAMTATAVSAKFVAAWLTQKTFRLSKDERSLIWGLSNSQAAATLAAVMVGYNVILNQTAIDYAIAHGLPPVEPDRLLSEAILNGSILMILISCTISSFVTQRGAKNIALLNAASDDDRNLEKALMTISVNTNIAETISLFNSFFGKKNDLYVMNIHYGGSLLNEQRGNQLLESAAMTASGADNEIHKVLLSSNNRVDAISNFVREHSVNNVIMAIDNESDSDLFCGSTIDTVLARNTNSSIFLFKSVNRLITLKRSIVVVPRYAENEIGFAAWITKLWDFAKNTAIKTVIYCHAETMAYLQKIQSIMPIEVEFELFEDFSDYLVLAREIKSEDFLIFVMSHKEKESYNPAMDKVPHSLRNYFAENTALLIFPTQATDIVDSSGDFHNAVINDTHYDNITKSISGMFRN
ncbi:MAG: cation:proton antiporter [Bacteroidales bacterium]|jgi:Kef-type K+ transport system membrane component KefB|nr:cation:proton antiporter [Bacteroidales bacterium]